MTIEEAKALMSPEALSKLKETVTLRPSINMDNKANNDILMNALCRAVNEGTILIDSLDDKIVKLLNAKTNTLSPTKLGSILKTIRETQPNIGCVISLVKPVDTVVESWVYTDNEVNFIEIFGYLLKTFDLTPNIVRTKMCEMLKPTIVNNIAQLVAKYQYGDEKEISEINVSITTLTRLANMCDHMLFADFKKVK